MIQDLQKKLAFEIEAQKESKDEVEKEVAPKVVTKKAQKLPSPPEKQYYSVSLEALVPTTLTYRVLAETPEQALELIKNAPLATNPKLQLARLRKLKASVYLSGTSIIKLTKNY